MSPRQELDSLYLSTATCVTIRIRLGGDDLREEQLLASCDVPKARDAGRRDLLHIAIIFFSMHPKWHSGAVLVLRTRESNKEAQRLP